jgi:hypothetical protein
MGREDGSELRGHLVDVGSEACLRDKPKLKALRTLFPGDRPRSCLSPHLYKGKEQAILGLRRVRVDGLTARERLAEMPCA